MSKIRIRNLCLEMQRVGLSEYNLYGNIEIVPRKIVEMIIEKCRQDIIKYNHNSEEAACIKQYAESLLKQFEEDDE